MDTFPIFVDKTTDGSWFIWEICVCYSVRMVLLYVPYAHFPRMYVLHVYVLHVYVALFVCVSRFVFMSLRVYVLP